MASFLLLLQQRDDIASEFFKRQREAEENRFREFEAVVKIQSCFRGWKVRKYVKFLHECATIIQSAVRRHITFKAYQRLVKMRLFEMRMGYYNKMATIIQSSWKGYYCRKYVHSYYSLKSYLNGVEQTNAIVRERLSVYKRGIEEERDRRGRDALEARRRVHASKTHYLLSTAAISGIYSSPHAKEVDERETWLRTTQPRSPPRTATAAATAASCQRESDFVLTLPPLTRVQGPFRHPGEVQRQRYKRLEPTLRVATDFYAVEKARVALKDGEWIRRMQDKDFTVVQERPKVYEQLLHTTSKFGRLAYGTKHFREPIPGKPISAKDFQTVVSPIPVFDQLNKTY
eukprot:m.5877 g.5877  ORF g.5877 m.5877 type:complete len:344 (+) comp14350_c0_seq1:32-1063(+)